MATTAGTSRLTADDWADAALTALHERGPQAVAVERVARALKATKGSFYWHFRSREALLEAALTRWEQRETDAVMAEAETGTTPGDKLEQLMTRILTEARRRPGGVALHAGSPEPALARAVARVAERRIAYVRDLLAATGLAPDEAERRAHLLYAMVLGLDALGAALPERLPDEDERAAWTASILAMAL